MSTTVISPSPFLQFVDDNGSPLASGTLATYYANTNIPLATYSDQTGTIPNSTTITLDGGGRADVWLGPYAYKFIVTSADGTFQHTTDQINAGNTASGTVGVDTVLGTTNSVRATSHSTGTDILVAGGYSAIGDEGGGMFYWNSTSLDADDAGYTILPTAQSSGTAGRWKRMLSDGRINVLFYGADRTGVLDCVAAFQSADALCIALNALITFAQYRVYLPAGVYSAVSDPSFTSYVEMEIGASINFSGTPAYNPVFNLYADTFADTQSTLKFPGYMPALHAWNYTGPTDYPNSFWSVPDAIAGAANVEKMRAMLAETGLQYNLIAGLSGLNSDLVLDIPVIWGVTGSVSNALSALDRGLTGSVSTLTTAIAERGDYAEGTFDVSFDTAFAGEVTIEASYFVRVPNDLTTSQVATVSFPKCQGTSNHATFAADGTYTTKPLPATIRPAAGLCMGNPPTGGDGVTSLYFPIVVENNNTLVAGTCRISSDGKLIFSLVDPATGLVNSATFSVATEKGFPAFTVSYPINAAT